MPKELMLHHNHKSFINLLAKSAEKNSEPGDYLSVCRLKDSRVRLERCNVFRLFFLMEGKARLSGELYGEHFVSAMEFILLPSSEEIDCEVFGDSQYVIVNCTSLEIQGNSSYWIGLKKQVQGDTLMSYPIFPIRVKLEKLLTYLVVSMNDERQCPSVCDIVFVILRLSYTHEEIMSLLYPMIGTLEGS